MLRTRIITALVLLAVLLPVLFLGSPETGAAAALVVVALACWEWMRLLRFSSQASAALAAIFAALVSATFWAPPILATGIMLAAAGFWCLVAPWWLQRGIPAAFVRTGLPLATIGVLVLAATWWGVIAALRRGPVYLLSVLAIVWISDVAAYFTGRAFGRHKLAPAISPGKTWEGVVGAVVVVLALAAVFALSVDASFGPSFIGMLAAHEPRALLPVALVALVALGIVGDLFESMLKRRAGVKDSSRLLPGHGGVFDRIDALLPVLPVALLIDVAVSGRPLLP